jgi:hypothetical protein
MEKYQKWKTQPGTAQWCMALITALRWCRQEDIELKATGHQK